MYKKIILNENDVKEIIAKHFNAELKNILIEHKERLVGLYEDKIPYIEIEVIEE